MIRYSRVIGTGAYLPEEVRTNEQISQTVDTSDSWIYERTGIRSRRIAGPNESAASMAEIAARQAIDAAQIPPESIDLIIVATGTPDRVYPSTGCLLQQRLGIKTCVAFDVQAACSGSIFALSIADQYIKTRCSQDGAYCRLGNLFAYCQLDGSGYLYFIWRWSGRYTVGCFRRDGYFVYAYLFRWGI